MTKLSFKSRKYPYIIAEIGCNHNGDLDLAFKLMLEAKKSGCDAVKFQLWQKDELATHSYLKALDTGKVKIENVKNWKTPEQNLNSIFAQVKKYSLTYKDHEKIFHYARKIGIDYSSTPITKEGIDFLVRQKASFIKISSMDINNIDLIEYALNTNLPVIISTGLADEKEISRVISLIPHKRINETALLHCISIYPPKDNILNLSYIKHLSTIYNGAVGYSDHTLGTLMPLIAIALGAQIIEKHFTLDKNMPGWDHKVSADPWEMKYICDNAKKIKIALGSGKERRLSNIEIEKRKKFRRSATTKTSLNKGHILTSKDIVFKRPGTGISPDKIHLYYGKELAHDISADHTLTDKDFIKKKK